LYLEHFGFRRLPFENTPDPAFFFMGSRYRDILALLMHSTVSRKGLMCITGPVGSGKTMLSVALAEHVPDQTRIIRLSHPSAAREELLPFIADSLEISVPPSGTLMLTEKIRENLRWLNEEGKQCLLIIDEAHLIRKEFFQEILVLSNLETPDFKLLQILLLGQRELADTFAQPDMRQLMQRLAVSATLDPMNREQSLRYIAHRLKIAGGSAEIFSPGVADALIRVSGGIPRNINKLCDAALLNAFVAGHPKVKEADFRRALENLGFRFSRTMEVPQVQESPQSFVKPEAEEQKNRTSDTENKVSDAPLTVQHSGAASDIPAEKYDKATDAPLTVQNSGQVLSPKEEKKLPEQSENETYRESVPPKSYPELPANEISEKFSAERTKNFPDRHTESPPGKSRLFFRIILSMTLFLSIALFFMIHMNYLPEYWPKEIYSKWFAKDTPDIGEKKQTPPIQTEIGEKRETPPMQREESSASPKEQSSQPLPENAAPAAQENAGETVPDKTKESKTAPLSVPDKTKESESATVPVPDETSEKKEETEAVPQSDAEDAALQSAPVQWDEETMNEEEEHADIEKYPYSVQLASFRRWVKAEKAFAAYRKKGLPVYWVKMNGEDGRNWFCIFAGIFEKRRDAEMFISSKNAEGAIAVRTSYAGLVKIFSSAQDASEYAASFAEKGYSFYVINRKDGKHYLYAGAFRTPEGAQYLCEELISKGIACRVVTR